MLQKDRFGIPENEFTPDLNGLIAWLETQDGATEYSFWSLDDCLICRFVKATTNWARGTGTWFPLHRITGMKN
jgi:hypothetical protein